MDAGLPAERPPHVPEDRVVDFDMYAPPGVKQDFHAAWKALQAPGVPDVVWTPRNGGHWIATRNRLIDEVFSDHERFSSRVILVPKAIGEQHGLIPTTLDPPEHRPYRTLLNSSMAPKVVGANEPRIRALAAELIEAVRRDGACNFTTAYAEILPIRIFLSMMDLPPGDAAQTKRWCDQMLRPDGSMSFEECMARLFDYLGPYVDARKGGDGDDMLSRMINGRIGDRALTRDEALKLSVQVLIAGLDTVVNFLGFAMLFLARNPAMSRELAGEPELMPAAVEEFLRRFPIVTIGREVARDMEYQGASLRKGEMILTPSVLGGIDERENERPMEVDFHRPTAAHVTFGSGHHKCPGAHLARTEIRVTLEEWLKRIPEFSVAPGKTVEFTGGIVGVVDALPLVWDVETTRSLAA
ncbi:MAG TPA: cytochrome P450 [Stellaceae bacterium]|nr:cytochrome P450 [Stellaceae bacterium]